jgi:hypothetical protein
MAIAIQEVHDFIRGLIKKNKGGFVSPKDIDRAVNRASVDWMSAILSKYSRTKKFEFDHLLVKKANFSVTSTTGTQSLPSDYVEGLTVYLTLSGGTPVEGTLYNWDEFLEIQNSSILAPTTSYPAATIFLDTDNTRKIQFSPIPPATGTTYTYTLIYFKLPAVAVYNYSTDNYGNITYVPSGSIDLDWDARYYGDILSRALMYLGISLDNQILLGAESLKDSNQKNDER